MTDSAGPPPFLIIVGSGRCGTTLLRAILDSHSRLAVSDEFSFLTLEERAIGRFGRFDWQRLYSRLELSESFVQRFGGEPEDLLPELAGAAPSDLGGFIRCVHTWYGGPDKDRYGTKVPKYAVAVARLGTVMPESRFVHMIRDGRDVVASYVEAGFGPDSATEAALRWRHRAGKARRAGRRLGSDRYLEVRYEELVAEPESEVKRVCAFLDLDFEPAMLDYYKQGDDYGAADSVDHRRLRQPVRPPTQDWPERLSEADAAAVEVVAGRRLREFGYPKPEAEPSTGARLRTTGEVVAVATRRVIRWIRAAARRPGRRLTGS